MLNVLSQVKKCLKNPFQANIIHFWKNYSITEKCYRGAASNSLFFLHSPNKDELAFIL